MKKKIIRQIVKSRQANQLSTIKAAELAEVSQATWWRIENEKQNASYEVLFRMLDALGVKWTIKLSP